MTTVMAAGASGPAKLQAVTQLMTKVQGHLESPTLSQTELEASLEQLKLYGRDPRFADPIFSQDGIKSLARLAFESQSRPVARGALRVLANSMLLRPNTRQTVVDLGSPGIACKQLREEGPKDWDDSFLLSRVLLLVTYAQLDLSTLIEENDMAGAIAANLNRHAEALDKSKPSEPAHPMQDMALDETLRLLFNVTHLSSEQASLFTSAVPPIVSLLWKQEIPPNRPLDPPFSSLVNPLLNLNLQAEEVRPSLFPKEKPTRVVERLVRLLELSLETKAYSETDLEQNLPPLIGVLQALHSAANDEVKNYLRTRLLPPEEDRKEALGRGASLGSKLLRNSNNPTTPQLGEVIANLLFELSDRDATQFVENVGFGYASGFLAKHNIATPENVAHTSNSTTNRPVNPITGQFLDEESTPDIPPMTDEEKLREAERLFVLFERLKQTGVMNVQNPVEQAMRSDRFQDLGEDRVTEVDSD
ncbi:hypothetical protein SODALDRAFT_348308 [Sodiomyces alkalinus F11]|uniref:Guanine nucleotide exchange factor synembryn n=1 Tax=Sodiomyces alkalinus (strain CBS 110278 / VKM F-3762 / F11) TaxID=1314773 RepID=A0A3N2QA53_SODAK|nr:hypothetical protein SODALDRAFT_348308 [Sodiomyces alkalinus F11]ROT43630.1 hypothetical protein SODALDRAFT_348308 [Sodiomyces alkalinus F11]